MQLLKELAVNVSSKYIDYEIKVKTAFGQFSHLSLSGVLSGFIKGSHSFQPNPKRGP